MAGPIRIAILANGSQARRELGQVQSSLGRLSASATKAAKVGFGALVVGAGALVKSSIDVEKQFSTSMRLIQANTKASSDEMQKLNDLAIKLGADTSFSAGEAADAMLELAKAGISTKTIMGGGLAGTLQLAAAGGTDLATASTIASNALNTFNLRGEDMASIAAALAGGANASTASVESLGQALEQVGPGATNVGLSLQETVAALSAFDAAGVKGSDAGTSLKTMLARLIPQTDKAAGAMQEVGLYTEETGSAFVNANGTFKSLAQISGILQRTLGGLSDAQRVQAINTIFGSDASRAATILTNEGAKGIRAYIKATRDQSAAQKAAAARMDGTEGALERLSGSIETAKLRLGQELAPAVTKGADALGDKLVPAMESAIDAGHDIANALAPAAREVGEALGHLAGEGDAAGKVFEDVFIPALKTSAEVVGGLVNFVDELPGPVKEIGVQAGIAALVFPRLAAGVSTASAAMTLNIAKLQQLRAEMTYTATRAQITSTAMSRLASGAKTAAGIGGMVALTQGAQASNSAIKTLSMTAGGALAGFAVAGPIGAAVGAFGGLTTAALNAGEAARTSGTTWQTYASTLDSVTAATTKATEAMALEELRAAGILKSASQLGIDKATLVAGVLGEADARGQLLKAMDAEQAAVDKLAATDWDSLSNAQNTALSTEYLNRKKNLEALQAEVGEVSKATAAKREDLLIMAQFPDSLITEIQTPGLVDSKRELAVLVSQYNLTPKQVKTAIEVIGRDKIKATKGEVVDLAKRLEATGKVRPTGAWADLFNQGVGKAKKGVKADTDAINRFLLQTGQVDAKIADGQFGKSVKRDLRTVKNDAAAGGVGVGDGLGGGMYSRMEMWIGPIRAKGVAMGKAAVDGAKEGAATHSPSRETIWVGRMLGEGLTVGMDTAAPAVGVAGRRLGKGATAAILAGASGGLSEVEAMLDKITKLVEKTIRGKNDDKREKKILKGYRDQFNALKANGAQIDAINDKLEQQRAAVEAAQQAYDDYTGAIKSAVAATGDITQLGRQDDGTVSITSLMNELETKAIRAERFQSLMLQLAEDGLSREQVDQMLAAGPEAALATAEAIASGGEAAIKQMNILQGRLLTAGDTLATSLAARFGPPLSNATYLAGVQAAQGLVNGTLVDLAAAEAAGEVLAAALLKGVKKKLKIKSPSRVFRELGGNVVEGLRIGIDTNSSFARGAAESLASDVVDGFGSPAIAAWAAAPGATSASTIRVRLSAEQVSQLQRGREIQMDLDYARSNGVTGTTF